jgi:hypothetical protein
MNPRFLLPLLLIPAAAHAATLSVLPNMSIQTKIDAAKAGDIVAIFGGTYNEDITINKAIRLVKVSGQSVTLAGIVTFSGVTNAPPFDGFTVGSSGRGINVNDTTGLVISNVDARAGSGVFATGNSLLKIHDSQLSNISANGLPLEISNCQMNDVATTGGDSLQITNCQFGSLNTDCASSKITKSSLRGNIWHNSGILHASTVTVAGNFDTNDNAQKTVGFRTTVAGDMTWRSKKAWFGYSKARSFYFAGSGAKVALVGTEIDRANGEAYGMKLHGSNNRYLVTNCNIHDIRWYYGWSEEIGIWVAGGGNFAVLQNNSIRMQFQEGPYWFYYSGVEDSDAIRIQDTTVVTIRNNIFYGCQYEINAPFGVTASNNLQLGPQGHYGGFEIRGGVIPINSVTADPLFVENEAPKLQAGSPCINAGTPDPLYNDRDGSQNDIGPAGGAWFDPEGWTTDKPVVISFDLSPEQVLEGADTEVVISNGGAVSQP